MTGVTDPDHDAMLAHYRQCNEAARLTRAGHSRLELERTRELLIRFLPPTPARILDVGGGTGVHAAWLTTAGYRVQLVDAVPEHVETALSYGTFGAALGDARRLVEPDASVDGVLLLGPLYHLTSAGDRHVALREAHRVLRPGGVLLAAAISRHMAVLDWAAAGGLTDEIVARLRPMLATGEHDTTLGFAPAHFHRADEFAEEVTAAGYADVRVLGIEGPAWPAVDAADDDRRPDIMASALRCARLLEDDPAVVAASGHLMAVGIRP